MQRTHSSGACVREEPVSDEKVVAACSCGTLRVTRYEWVHAGRREPARISSVERRRARTSSPSPRSSSGSASHCACMACPHRPWTRYLYAHRSYLPFFCILSLKLRSSPSSTPPSGLRDNLQYAHDPSALRRSSISATSALPRIAPHLPSFRINSNNQRLMDHECPRSCSSHLVIPAHPLPSLPLRLLRHFQLHLAHSSNALRSKTPTRHARICIEAPQRAVATQPRAHINTGVVGNIH